MTDKTKSSSAARFGIGEWYGRSFVHLTPAKRSHYAQLQQMPSASRPAQPCLPQTGPGGTAPACNKAGGVCSLRRYSVDPESGVAPTTQGALVTTCPQRFGQDGLVFEWVGETMLGHAEPLVINEIGFLERRKISGADQQPGGGEVGRIDNVLVHPELDFLEWCALEIQAVYFSGGAMGREYAAIRNHEGDSIPFPVAHRRPDYRSSGPKRLMPQLQIKVPSLRRWGKKMAVVVDDSFFSSLGEMDAVDDVSNCDIAWFVVKYDESGGQARLQRNFVQFTTLERAVEGLTGGDPVSLPTFEGRIREKLASITHQTS